MIYALFSSSGFIPRRLCGLWTPTLLAIHMTSEFIIWSSYLCIACMLFRLVMLWQKGRIDFAPAKHYAPTIAIVFGAFILLCSGTHMNGIIVFYYPWYRFIGLWSAVTALVSFLAVITLCKALALSTKASAEPRMP